MHAASGRRQRGATLVEALVAFLVLSVGIVVVSQVHAHLRLHADIARQRAEAVRFAQQDIEAFRGFATLAPAAGMRSYDALATATQPVTPPAGDPTTTAYTLSRGVNVEDGFKTARVAVQWTDTAGMAQHSTLDTVVAGVDPTLATSLTIPRADIRGVAGRAPAIPAGAVPLGDGRSVYKPLDTGTLAWVFDDLSGALRSTCTVPAATPTAQLVASDLGDCAPSTEVLLGGVVRFDAGIAPLPLDVELVLTGTEYTVPPLCTAELHKVVDVPTAVGARRHEVPVGATPAVLGAASWSDTGERFVAYHCVIVPAQGRWSGRSHLQPKGWTIGHGGVRPPHLPLQRRPGRQRRRGQQCRASRQLRRRLRPSDAAELSRHRRQP